MVFCYANSSTHLYLRCTECGHRYKMLPGYDTEGMVLQGTVTLRGIGEKWRKKLGGAPLECPSCGVKPEHVGAQLLEMLSNDKSSGTN